MRSDSGSYPLAASLEWPAEGEKQARVVLFGDLDFATNRSTAIQHDGGKVQLALPVIAFR
jgi:hypothetical protein